MIRYISVFTLIVFGGTLFAQIHVQICDPCDLSPLTVDQVMTGKHCSLLVSSDANDLWSGGLFLSGQNRELGILKARNRDPNSRDWKGSHLEDAGPMAKVYAWNDSAISGFDFYTSEYDGQPGDWFLIDYQALAPGDCTIGFYDHGYSWTAADPNIVISIENIPFVDFYTDDVVDLKDLMILASHWLAEDCNEPSWCELTDIYKDGTVDITDITIFAQYWLWGSPNYSAPPAEPNTPPPAEEPNEPSTPDEINMTYSIHDANSLDEITLEVGQSVRLYISKESVDVNSISFCLEVYISDPNWGSIDNQEYDPNDPNNPTQAEVLAQPRDSLFDYYGPGNIQYESIQFTAFNFSEYLEDGLLASFVYTANQPGEVVLMLIDYEYASTHLEPIFIHQVLPGQAYGGYSDPNDLAEFLTEVWNTSPDIQSSTSWAEWQAFIEDVMSSQ